LRREQLSGYFLNKLLKELGRKAVELCKDALEKEKHKLDDAVTELIVIFFFSIYLSLLLRKQASWDLFLLKKLT
jgi:hypothetical protein